MYTLPSLIKRSQHYSYWKLNKSQLGYSYGMLKYNQLLKHLVPFVEKVGMLSIRSFSIHCIMQLVFLMFIQCIMISPVDCPIYLWNNRGLLSRLLGKCCDCLSQDAWTMITLYKNSHKYLPLSLGDGNYPWLLRNSTPFTLSRSKRT